MLLEAIEMSERPLPWQIKIIEVLELLIIWKMEIIEVSAKLIVLPCVYFFNKDESTERGGLLSQWVY